MTDIPQVMAAATVGLVRIAWLLEQYPQLWSNPRKMEIKQVVADAKVPHRTRRPRSLTTVLAGLVLTGSTFGQAPKSPPDPSS